MLAAFNVLAGRATIYFMGSAFLRWYALNEKIKSEITVK